MKYQFELTNMKKCSIIYNYRKKFESKENGCVILNISRKKKKEA